MTFVKFPIGVENRSADDEGGVDMSQKERTDDRPRGWPCMWFGTATLAPRLLEVFPEDQTPHLLLLAADSAATARANPGFPPPPTVPPGQPIAALRADASRLEESPGAGDCNYRKPADGSGDYYPR